MSQPNHKLYYWPVPFRGCFVSYQFAYRNVPLLHESSYEKISGLMLLDPSEQHIPFMGPPVLEILDANQHISQMPAIVLYTARELNLLPDNHFDAAMCLKVLMDCNDLLMEICRYNGSMMWDRQDWIEFRSRRLPRWMKIFEESLARGTIGADAMTFADISVYALFGNMTRCLPELESDLHGMAPGIQSLCDRIGSTPSLERFVAEQESEYGDLYCGGQIESSIREMLALDASG